MRATIPFGAHHVYDRFVAGWFLRFYRSQLHRFADAERVLDIGCGPGRLARTVAEAYPDAHVIGADLDPAQVRIAARHADGNLSFVHSASDDLHFPDGHFDAAVTTESYHHWHDPEAGLRELARVIRPGGRMMVWELAGDIQHDEMCTWAGRIPKSLMPMVRRATREHGFTPAALRDRLVPAMEAHFHDVQVERDGGWWLVTGTV